MWINNIYRRKRNNSLGCWPLEIDFHWIITKSGRCRWITFSKWCITVTIFVTLDLFLSTLSICMSLLFSCTIFWAKDLMTIFFQCKNKYYIFINRPLVWLFFYHRLFYRIKSRIIAILFQSCFSLLFLCSCLMFCFPLLFLEGSKGWTRRKFQNSSSMFCFQLSRKPE